MIFSQAPDCCFLLTEQVKHFLLFHKIASSHGHLIKNYRYKYMFHIRRDHLHNRYRNDLLFTL